MDEETWFLNRGRRAAGSYLRETPGPRLLPRTGEHDIVDDIGTHL